MVINFLTIKDSGILSAISLIASIIWLIFWCKTFNQAWKALNKKHGWAIGLTAIIPFGAIIGIVAANHYLKGTEYWRGEYKSFRLSK